MDEQSDLKSCFLALLTLSFTHGHSQTCTHTHTAHSLAPLALRHTRSACTHTRTHARTHQRCLQLYKSDVFSSKAASHGIKAYSALLERGHADLHFPLCCRVEYLGRSFLVQSLVDVEGTTSLQLGTDDGARRVMKGLRDVEIPHLREALVKLGDDLRLKRHVVKGAETPFAADVEVRLYSVQCTINSVYVQCP